MANELVLRAEICEAGRRLWQRGLIGAAEGNITARLDDRTILCTPPGLSKGHLKPTDIVVLSLEPTPAELKSASSEVRLHLVAYRQRPDCMAVVHAHPPVTTGYALAGEEFPDNILPEAAVILGSIVVLPFAMPGTDEVPDGMKPYLADHKTFVLSNHGAATLGNGVFDACNRMETLERVATVYYTAKLLGGMKPMPTSAFDHYLATALNGSLG